MDPSDEGFELVGNPLDAAHAVSDTASCGDSSDGDKGSGEDVFHNATEQAPVNQETKAPASEEAEETFDEPMSKSEEPKSPVLAEPKPVEVPADTTSSSLKDEPINRQVSGACEEPPAVADVEVKHLPDDDVLLREEWSQSECHMQDIRYAQQDAPAVPHRKSKQQLKVLVCGQAETGKTMLIRNLFASYTKDPSWVPVDVSGLTAKDFATKPDAFQTIIDGASDASGNLAIKFIIQEAPALDGSPEGCTDMLLSYIKNEQAEYVRQEQDLSLPRAAIADGRVDVCLYALPTNVRVSAFDLAIMQELCAVVPTIAVMCKADCMTVVEVNERRKEMRKLVQEGLNLYQFPSDVVARLEGFEVAEKQAPPPFIIMVGNESDDTVHPFWFVRKYRWGTCEAYREVDSDLKWLRQLVLEHGFWSIKDAAEQHFREAAANKQLDKAKAANEKLRSEDGRDTVHSSSTVSTSPTDLEPALARLDVRTGPLNEESWFEPQLSASLDEVTSTKAVPAAANDALAALAFDKNDYYSVQVQDVLRTHHGNTFRCTLSIPEIAKVLCMRIGASEGTCLLNVLRNSEATRPCTYESWLAMIQATGGRVERVVISNCTETVFYARIHAVQPCREGDKAVDIDARPSDAFNLALRSGAPIFLRKKVADQYAKSPSKHLNIAGLGVRF